MPTPDYRDPSLPVEERVEDLLARMTLAEKAGQLFHTPLTMNSDGSLHEGGGSLPYGYGTTELVTDGHLTHVDLVGRYGVRETAEWVNRLQALAADTRLGIPVTLSTDPRHSYTHQRGAPFATGPFSVTGPFSAWPEPAGLAAIGDAELVERFGDTVRREYLAVGFRVAVHPAVRAGHDLATGHGGADLTGTFGSSTELMGELLRAYVRGLQGPRLGPRSVAAMFTHFTGGDRSLAPAEAAVDAGCSRLMPYPARPFGTGDGEPTGIDSHFGVGIGIGIGIDRDALTRPLHERLGFDGVVCTAPGLLTGPAIPGEPHGKPGAEHLSLGERAARALDAGADQFGGEGRPDVIVELVRSGRISEERVDASVRRLLREKFRLGLFERRYVDPDRAEETVGAAEFTALGATAQRRSLTILTNHSLLPLTDRPNLYVDGVGAQTASLYGNVVADPTHADVAVLRLRAPHAERPDHTEPYLPPGAPRAPRTSASPTSPAPGEKRLREILALLDAVPTLVCVTLERPAVHPEIASRAAALVADYGASDTALLDVVFGRARAEGRLPFELRCPTAVVEESGPDVPNATGTPLFPYGHGLEI
ncbi:glycoside hydrolase family 3 protein [Streptomyces neyagawaensis]|uniref:glycoside hydrolase family 3 protein n=1 Tax=Streptomyces neyagawaensis TaxID=42238 RepID=UPI0006E3AF45|nr:glycoside hydrolase family 3 N-terminal domain-containing protein [Streptomyces neyagawaensis]MCL6737198.1 glycoside hydrolase family 3 protein [Streptomyces neyagawaensis]MDE1687971.1 glycoside hydrolase family 3 N-terminal domain-containing protein [Streptomyces neyagawaensis]